MQGYKKKLAVLFSSKKGKQYGTIVAISYFLIFLFALGNILIAGEGEKLTYGDTPSLQVLPDWPEKLFKELRPFNFEAIGAVYFTEQLGFLISPMNMLLNLLLSTLVGLNILVVVFGWEQPKMCDYKGKAPLLLSLSSLLTGFSCCVPMFLLLLGSSFAAFSIGAIAFISIFYPISIVGLSAGFFFSVRRISFQAIDELFPESAIKNNSIYKCYLT